MCISSLGLRQRSVALVDPASKDLVSDECMREVVVPVGRGVATPSEQCSLGVASLSLWVAFLRLGLGGVMPRHARVLSVRWSTLSKEVSQACPLMLGIDERPTIFCIPARTVNTEHTMLSIDVISVLDARLKSHLVRELSTKY